ncbi:MAG: POTRA domain-containing protein [Vicinamibacterales bacterium]
MRRVAASIMAGWLLAGSAGAAPVRRQDPAAALQPEHPILTDVRILGASIYTPDELRRRHGLEPGVRLKEPPEAIGNHIRRRYAADGYSFAQVAATLDDARALTIEIDEGQIDEIEFHGVKREVADRLREEFAVRPGDVFNRPQAVRALDEALRAGQGAIERRRSRDTFSLVRESGRRVLQVDLRTRSTRSGLFVGTQSREDWYSPVDGFSPAVGFQSTIFDAERFNHTYWGGYVSYKFASERAGYSFGLERPFFADGVLQLGGSIQDLSASDDHWRLGIAEQSLVAFGFRNSFRDYYRRKGYQLHAAVRPHAGHEWLVAWRDEEHLSLANETGYGLFRDDHAFRANAPAGEGTLRALIVGYTFDTRGLTHEPPGDRFRRHQLDSLFGSSAPRDHGARIEWTSEVAPSGFGHDFDFSRHVLNARVWRETSPSRLLSGRVIAGLGGGTLPPQRAFGLGGIGSVHGYSFKEALGERMLLLNGEIRQRFGRSGLAGVAFVDTGRVYRPLAGSTTEWLNGVGVGVDMGEARIELGWRLDDIPRSLQVLFRLGPTF